MNQRLHIVTHIFLFGLAGLGRAWRYDDAVAVFHWTDVGLLLAINNWWIVRDHGRHLRPQ